MRMWMVPPQIMCRQHLLGEHLECHMFASTIKEGKSIQGYLNNQLVETHRLKVRHDELVREMKRRGYNHKSPLKFNSKLVIGYVDSESNLNVLRRRCKKCRRLQDGKRI